jgi:hypothetical protein
MIAADFLGDPTGTGLDMPSQTDRASAGLTEAGVNDPAGTSYVMSVTHRYSNHHFGINET